MVFLLIMGIIQRIKDKAGRVAPAVMGLSMIAGVGMMAVTGDASALTDANGTTIAWWEQYGLLTYIFGALTVIFGIATVWMKDFRLALVTILAGVLAILSTYLA